MCGPTKGPAHGGSRNKSAPNRLKSRPGASEGSGRIPPWQTDDGRGGVPAAPPGPERHAAAQPHPWACGSTGEPEDLVWTLVTNARAASKNTKMPKLGRIHGGFWSQSNQTAPQKEKACRRRRNPKHRSASGRRYQASRRPAVNPTSHSESREARAAQTEKRTTPEERKAISQSRAGILLMSWNAYGIADATDGASTVKKDEIVAFLEAADARNEHVHGIAFQETWLQGDDALEIRGYEWFGRNRSEARSEPDAKRGSGGVGWLLCSKLLKNGKVTVSRNTHGACEGLITVTLKKENKILTLMNAYRELPRRNFVIDDKKFVEGVLGAFEAASALGCDDRIQRYTYLMCDANIRVGMLQDRGGCHRGGETTDSGPLAKMFVAAIENAGGCIVHGRLCPWDYTFQPENQTRRSVVDYVVTDDLEKVIEAGVCDRESADIGSDHRALFIRADVTFSGRRTDRNPAKIRDDPSCDRRCPYSRGEIRGAYEPLNKLITQLIEEKIAKGEIDRGNNADVNWEAWKRAMLDAAVTIVPAKPEAKGKAAASWQPWWNPAGKRLRERRLGILSELRAMERSGRDADAQVLRGEYRDALKALKKHARESRLAFLEKRNKALREYASDASKATLFWKTVLGTAAKNAAKATAAIIELWSSSDKTATTNDPTEVAGIFGREFSRIGADAPPEDTTFDMNERARQDSRVAEILRMPGYDGPIGHWITRKEICTCIGKLKYGKASGLDFISTDLLKTCVENTSMVAGLRVLFNACLRTGRCPKDWQTAAVKCLFKKGDRRSWENYRLISLLSVVGKLFEAVLARRLSTLLDGRDSNGEQLLSMFQGGFRGGRRCQHLSWSLVETVKSLARRGKDTYAAFLDVRKAYPTTRRSAMLERLFEKLSRIGDRNRRCRAWTVIENMLREDNCKSRVVVDGHVSAEYTVGHGLREGAVLSPILYAVFIDEIVKELEDCKGVAVGDVKIRCLLYADDVVLLSESAPDLQSMLDRCQKFADRSSFEFSMQKSHVVKFGDDADSGVEFKLMGKTMIESDRYTYLGVELHRSLGRHARAIAGERMRRKFLGKKMIDDDEREERVVVSVFYCDEADVWIAQTERVGSEESETEEYYLNDASDMKKMIDRYTTRHGGHQETYKPPLPWAGQIQKIREKLVIKRHMLRRAGCHAFGLNTVTAKLVVMTMCDALAVQDSEVWQMKETVVDLQTEMNAVHRTMIGAEAHTSTTAVRHEVGCASQRVRADAAALRFRNNILSLKESEHVARQLYRALQKDDEPLGSGVTTNAVKGFLEPLAARAAWKEPVGPYAAKTRTKAYVKKYQNQEFEKDLKDKSSLANMAKWVRVERQDLPAYLSRPCPIGLREGRQWKTKFRVGRHRLQSSLAVRERTRKEKDSRDYTCKCCDRNVPETVKHALLECVAHEKERESFMRRMDEVAPVFRRLAHDEKVEFLMADGPPVETDSFLYRFLMNIRASRERWLGSPTAQGVGPRP